MNDNSLLEYIEKAKQVKGGHASIGRGGATIHYAWGSRISSYACEKVKKLCIEHGLPVIDSRNVDIGEVAKLVFTEPMIEVGECPFKRANEIELPRMLQHYSLEEGVAAYRAIGAEIYNI